MMRHLHNLIQVGHVILQNIYKNTLLNMHFYKNKHQHDPKVCVCVKKLKQQSMKKGPIKSTL